MKILSFDTSLNKTYVTLSENGKILSSKTVENKDEKYHSAFLISTIVEILKEHKLQIKDMDAFGVNIGPGSFTGIRACITVARVFAQQTEKPLVGVSSLEILSKLNQSKVNNKDYAMPAEAGMTPKVSDNQTIVLLDARREQVYAGVYKNGEEISEPKLIKIEEIDSLPLPDSKIICDTFVKGLLSEKNIECIDYTESGDDLGIYLSEIVQSKLTTENQSNDYFWANTKPLYLQTPPISCKPSTVI